MHRWSLVGKPIFRKSIMIPISTKTQSWEYCSQNPFHPLNYRDYRLYEIPIMGHCSKKPVHPLNPHHVQWFFLSALPGENWPRWTLYGGMLGRRPKKWTCLIKRPFENCIVDRFMENPFSKEVSWPPFYKIPIMGSNIQPAYTSRVVSPSFWFKKPLQVLLQWEYSSCKCIRFSNLQTPGLSLDQGHCSLRYVFLDLGPSLYC